VKWLQNKLDEFLSPLNKSYFSQLWSKFGRNWAPAPYNINAFLLYLMQNDAFSDEINRMATELFRGAKNRGNLFLSSVSKVCLFFTYSPYVVAYPTQIHLSLESNLVF
jgi:hypothetical protein